MMADAGQVADAAVFAAIMSAEEDEMIILQDLMTPKRKHSTWVRPWIIEKEENECNTTYKLQKRLLECDLTEFCRMLRMSPVVFEFILQGIQPRIEKANTNYRKSISAEERLLMTLKYLATGESPLSLSQAYRVGRCTVGRVCKETCQAIYDVFKQYIRTPRTPAEWAQVVNGFDQRWNYPGCLGAIDGKHVRLMKPWGSGSTYFNYKKFFSIVMLAVVNANYEFIYLSVGAEGASADGGLWKESDLYNDMVTNKIALPADIGLRGQDSIIPCHFIGDDAFAMSPRLLKPFSKKDLDDPEEIFNYRLSRARRVVENVFGICAARFRVLRGEIAMNPDAAGQVVLAICTLHNILREMSGASYMPYGSIDYEDNVYVIQPGRWRADRQNMVGMGPNQTKNSTDAAKAMRNELATYFQTPTGSVDWQEKHH